MDITSPKNANKCVQTDWVDADGKTISSSTIPLDGAGVGHGPIPEGARSFVSTIVDCPDRQDFSGTGTGSSRRPVRSLSTFLVFGGPLVPSDAPGTTNLTFSFQVRTPSLGAAKRLTRQVLRAGIGAPVPPGVEIFEWSTMTADISGGRFVSALPGGFVGFSLDLNNGAYHADLATGSNLLHYPSGTWDVVEALIPTSDFHVSVLPGATYSNSGTSTHTSKRHPNPVTHSVGFEITN